MALGQQELRMGVLQQQQEEKRKEGLKEDEEKLKKPPLLHAGESCDHQQQIYYCIVPSPCKQFLGILTINYGDKMLEWHTRMYVIR